MLVRVRLSLPLLHAMRTARLPFPEYGFRVQVGTRVLAFQFNVDNTAPPTVQNVLDFWAVQRAAYPNAKLMAATLDDFAEYAISQKASLPRMNMEVWHLVSRAPWSCV